MSRNCIALSAISISPTAIQLNLVWFKLSEFLNKKFSLAPQGEMLLQLQFFFFFYQTSIKSALTIANALCLHFTTLNGNTLNLNCTLEHQNI